MIISENVRIGTSENLPPHKSNEKIMAKIIRTNFFGALDIKQRLVVTQGVFIQEKKKWLNSPKSSNVFGVWFF